MNSDLIKKWSYDAGYFKKSIELFPHKVIVYTDINGFKRKNNFSLNEYFEQEIICEDLKTDYEVYKEIVKLLKPEKMGRLARKNYNFWRFYDSPNVKERVIFTKGNVQYIRNKYGFYVTYSNLKNKKYENQLPNLFLFDGPAITLFSLKERLKLKHEILDVLNKNGGKYKKSDGFTIFDYEKIPVIKYEKEDGYSGVFFSIERGEVSAGGWSNPREGGSRPFTIEFLWNYPEKCVPAEFHNQIPYILEKLDQAVVHE